MLAQLGAVTFSGLMGFDGISRTSAAILPEHPLIGSKSRLQHTGGVLDAVSITIRLHSAFCDPEAQIATLRSYISDGEIVPLIKGTGENMGDFVLASMQEDILNTDPSGAIILVVLSVSLIEHFDPDKLATMQDAAVSSAIAVEGANIRPISSITVAKITEMRVPAEALSAARLPYAAASVASDVNIANLAANKISGTLTDLAAYPARAAYYYDQISTRLNVVQQAVVSAQKTFSSVDDFTSRFPNLLGAINAVGAAASSFSSSVPPGSPSDLTAVNANFQTTVINMKMQAASLAGLIASRKR